jgi:hypothetical protein
MLWNGNECGKTKVMRISRQPSIVHCMMGQKLLENVENLNYLCSMITNDARCTRETKSSIVMEKAAFNKKKTLFTRKMDLNSGKKLVIVKCYIWSVALYGAETWTLRKVHQDYLESFETLWWRRMEISWTDPAREEVGLLHRVKR